VQLERIDARDQKYTIRPVHLPPLPQEQRHDQGQRGVTVPDDWGVVNGKSFRYWMANLHVQSQGTLILWPPAACDPEYWSKLFEVNKVGDGQVAYGPSHFSFHYLLIDEYSFCYLPLQIFQAVLRPEDLDWIRRDSTKESLPSRGTPHWTEEVLSAVFSCQAPSHRQMIMADQNSLTDLARLVQVVVQVVGGTSVEKIHRRTERNHS
jgi:hypothetical protein